MMLFRISAVILAFAAIESHGAVNVTASREYVDRKVTSVSNSIMDEVSSNLRKIESIEKNTYTKDETDKKIVELATTNGVASSVSAATNAMEAAGTDHQIVRGERMGDIWDLRVASADRADNVPWAGIYGAPTTLAGYGVAEEVTNTVCNIVTNEVLGWTVTTNGVPAPSATVDYTFGDDTVVVELFLDGVPVCELASGDFAVTNETSLSITVDSVYNDGYAYLIGASVAAERRFRNALGLARLSDLEEGVQAAVSAATNDPTIVRGEKLDAPPDVWGISVSRALTASQADEALRAGTAESVLSVPWNRVEDTPMSLSGYGITDAVPSSRTVNGKPLTSDITLSASDLGAATVDDLAAATTNVVHGDYSNADRAAFPRGLGFKAGDGTDKGYVGLRLRNTEGHGLEVIATKEVTVNGVTRIVPYTLFQLTDSVIKFPKEGLVDTVQGSDFTSMYWDDFSRANHVLNYMPSSGTSNYEGYPISGKAFNEYFWGLSDLPAKAKASVTVHAASNLVGVAGAPVGVSDIIGSAVRESVLAVTSDVPVYAYSTTWTSDWPADDSAQPSQPQWADGTWSVYLVEGGQTLPGTYSVEGPEDATTLTIDIVGFPTVFTRESTVSGYVNAHGFARMGDVDSKIASATNGLLRTESDPMFAGWKGSVSLAAGDGAVARDRGVALGEGAKAGYGGVSLGEGAKAGYYGVALGHGTVADDEGIALGDSAVAGNEGIAIGPAATAGVSSVGFAFGPGKIFFNSFIFNDPSRPKISLQTLLDAKASTEDIQAAISATNPTFSNAVLAVGLNIDTNSVAVLNEIASTFGGFPIEGTATTVGGLLAALAAAIVWLKKNKADKTELEGFATIEDLLAFYYPDGNVTSMNQITTNGIEYAVGEDGGAYVASGNGLSGHVVLPWKVTIGGHEYKVTAIDPRAFDGGFHNNNFTGLTAPTTVKIIGNSAFGNCGLTTINLPSATSIGNSAFNTCGLTTINLPSATSIGVSAFNSCISLTSVNLPSATSIGDDAFGNCGLTTINLPSATSIGNSAFNRCGALTTINLPSATSIGDNAFDSCGFLTTINSPSVTNLGEGAFMDCSSLTLVDFGSSPKSSVPSLSAFSFEGVPTSCKFIIPIGMYADWISASGWSGLYAQGYKFEGYASMAQVANKADKTALDELAAKVDAANTALEEVA